MAKSKYLGTTIARQKKIRELYEQVKYQVSFILFSSESSRP
jgi:hypothetical protein